MTQPVKKLVVPHTGKLHEADARVIRLAEFLGIQCEALLLEKRLGGPITALGNALSDHGSCFLINPQVIKDWTGGLVPDGLFGCLTSHCSHILVLAAGLAETFEQSLIKTVSGGRLNSARAVSGAAEIYEIAPNSQDICGAFSGLSFGPVNRANDRVFSADGDAADLRSPISISGSPFMALVKRGKAEIVFLGAADVLDLNDEICDIQLSDYFSRFVAQAMALRYIFREQCWHPCGQYASFIIDDPLLQPRYGYLDYGSLLNLMEEYNFASTIAFIPHNYRRSSEPTVEIFQQSKGRLAICFHGNDHTAAEFASADTARLNSMLRTAEARMNSHAAATGLPCPKVMVFPQDNFSVEAAKVLKSRNFWAAACGTANPMGRQMSFTLRERAQPAIIRHGNFPVFLRKLIGQVKKQDLAFNLFFGQPILVAEHHGIFGRVKSLLDDVFMINSMGPAIQWCDLGTAVLNSSLHRRTPDGVHQIRAYSSSIQVANELDSPGRFSIEWSHNSDCAPIEQVLQGGEPLQSFTVGDSTIQASIELCPRSRQIVSLAYRNELSDIDGAGFLCDSKAFVRRRLSEVRDNYISKNEFAMALGQTIKRRILSKVL